MFNIQSLLLKSGRKQYQYIVFPHNCKTKFFRKPPLLNPLSYGKLLELFYVKLLYLISSATATAGAADSTTGRGGKAADVAGATAAGDGISLSRQVRL